MTLSEIEGTLLTVDLDLHLAVSAANMSSINYNYIREQREDYLRS